MRRSSASAALLAVVLLACGHHDAPPPPPELAACNTGNGSACFVVGTRYHLADGDKQLDRAIDAWSRGCDHGNAASCGQLGTIAEFGMGGHPVDQLTAQRYYTIACHGGDRMSCKALGIPDPPPAFDWAGALAQVTGTHAGEIGPAFGVGYTLGQPVPDALAAWQKQFGAKIWVRRPDPSVRGTMPELNIRFEGQKGLAAALQARWGPPQLAGPIWIDAAHHLTLFVVDDGHANELAWAPYRSPEELVLPGEPTRLGLEPIPLLGATIADVQKALGDVHVFRDGEDDYSWADYGSGPIEIRVTTSHDKIVHVHVGMLTNSGAVSRQIVDLLVAKYGAPRKHDAVLVWKKPPMSVTDPAPNSGNVDIDLGH